LVVGGKYKFTEPIEKTTANYNLTIKDRKIIEKYGNDYLDAIHLYVLDKNTKKSQFSELKKMPLVKEMKKNLQIFSRFPFKVIARGSPRSMCISVIGIGRKSKKDYGKFLKHKLQKRNNQHA
jgi:hypothetical protein